MTDDGAWYSPNAKKPPARQPRVGEFLYEFVRESDRTPVRCELLDHGQWGVEAQFFIRGEFVMSRRFDTRALAVQWAEAERPDLEKGEA